MSVLGLTCSSRLSYTNFCTRSREICCAHLLPFPKKGFSKENLNLPFLTDGKYLIDPAGRSRLHHTLQVSMDSSFGSLADDSNAFFPRMNVKDPYKRLGVSREASEEEIQSARNFLINKYAKHQPSIDAIESAHDKIIMQKFYERKNPKINISKKVREVTQSRYVKAITSRFETPSTIHIIKTSITFLALGALTVLFPTEEGPTLQVAISLIASIYFIHGRLKSQLRAFLYGAGSFVLSWLVCTFLMVSVVPPLLRGPRSLEVTTSLLSYAVLWVSSTYLK